MLDARFPTYSPGSRRLIDFQETDEEQLLLTEIRRTIEQLAVDAPGRIAKGTLTRNQASTISFLWLAIAEDLDRGPDNLSDEMECAHLRKPKVAGNGIRWSDKVEALRREIETRRTGQSGDVAKGRLTADQAKLQLERLEAVHDLYWRHGYAFDGSKDELRAMTGPILDFDVEQQGAAAVASAHEAAA